MYVTTRKGKRVYFDTLRQYNPASSKFENNSSIDKHWSTTDNIWNIFKTRPNIVDHTRKAKTPILYWMSNVITKLVITKDDVLDMCKDNSNYNYFRSENFLIIKEDKFIDKYNKDNNTDIRYVSYGKEYNQFRLSLKFASYFDKDFRKIEELPDDWTTSIEVYRKEDFSPITEYTDAEKRSIAKYKLEDNNQAIFDTFLKQSLETIMDEFGLYYNDYFKSFRFKSIKDFRNFLVTAINEIIVKKLHEHNVNCLQIRDLINVRCMRIEPEAIDIIKACDITMLNDSTISTKETNNE